MGMNRITAIQLAQMVDQAGFHLKWFDGQAYICYEDQPLERADKMIAYADEPTLLIQHYCELADCLCLTELNELLTADV
jgi:hypothetical protein